MKMRNCLRGGFSVGLNNVEPFRMDSGAHGITQEQHCLGKMISFFSSQVPDVLHVPMRDN
ncbi:hypothetical protein HMPREF0290_0540 [Corynebacterium efficiens YS-314]|nr:hypothetical protein HMPREF0290_0540 [Corynebacterium efficiens YS-314]